MNETELLGAGLCEYPEHYKYPSAKYYCDGIDEFGLFNLKKQL